MPFDEPLYPVNLRISGRRCLVVGGGRIALGKVMGLVEAGARVHVIAPAIVDELRALNGIEIDERDYRDGDARGHRLVIAATGDAAVNRRVFEDADAEGTWVNAADDPENCTFTVPARVRRGQLLVTFSTGGASPALASWLRGRYSEEFGPEYEILTEMLSTAREEMRADGVPTEGLGWQRALDSGMLELIREGRLAEAKERLQACLSSSSG